MEPHQRKSLDVSADRKPTLTTTRRNLIAGWKLCAGAALGLYFESSRARAKATACTAAAVIKCNCFLPGTRIRTAKGDINFEELRIGDEVLTVSGETKPIKFIGCTKVSRERTEPWKTGVGPVKISRFAIDGKVPDSDLYVSPWHAIYIDNMLIPVKYLVNGVTIVADARPEELSLTYYHIELDTHEPILAEGLAVESFLCGSPHAFDNADDYVSLYGAPGEPLTPFAPYVHYNNRQKLASHIRSALAPIFDLRKPIDKLSDRIAERAEFARAA
jgi:hypothetical protein